MARLVSLNRVPLNGVFIIPTCAEVDFFLNRFRDVPGFVSPESKKLRRGFYDRSSKCFFCVGNNSPLCMIPSTKLVIYFPY